MDLLAAELARFERDYGLNFLEGETKPAEVGRPYLLEAPAAATGILLIHGLMAAPLEVRELAEGLHAAGYTVYAPRLAGHGTSADDLANQSRQDWRESVERGYAVLTQRCERVIVAGFSTGAGLALDQAVRHAERYAAVIAISAPLVFANPFSNVAGLACLANRLLKLLGLARFSRDFATNHPDNPDINYRRCPLKSLYQVGLLMRRVYLGLGAMKLPTLIVQGNGDPKVAPVSGPALYRRIGSRTKRFALIECRQHGIVRGPAAAATLAAVSDFLAALPDVQAGRWSLPVSPA
jgi:carboxylesterase